MGKHSCILSVNETMTESAKEGWKERDGCYTADEVLEFHQPGMKNNDES